MRWASASIFDQRRRVDVLEHEVTAVGEATACSSRSAISVGPHW